MAESGGHRFGEKLFAPWNRDHSRQEDRCPNAGCFFGSGGMLGAVAFPRIYARQILTTPSSQANPPHILTHFNHNYTILEKRIQI